VLLFGASVLGSAHCVRHVRTLCGDVARPSSSPGARPFRRHVCGLRVLFNLGRIATYSLIGPHGRGPLARLHKRRQAASAWTGIRGDCGRRGGLGLWLVDDRLVFAIRRGVVAMAGLGRWLMAGPAGRLKSGASPRLSRFSPGELCKGWLPWRPWYTRRASRASLAGHAHHGRSSPPCWCLDWERWPAVFCDDAGSTDAVCGAWQAQRLGGRAGLAGLGSTC